MSSPRSDPQAELIRTLAIEELGWPTRINRAKTICAGCPVKEACLEWVTTPTNGVDPAYGMVAAGLTPYQRSIRGRRQAACGTPSGYQRHRRLGESICQACSNAHAAACRNQHHQRKAEDR